ncbi:hypothetical protein HZU75_11980 [Chitinibacter fontanus]|uniref:Uncharacterized protein n=1 Tax=Chitinibacter fontanus TaxID=1737446 RepID=A0A7D5ZER0_9NEIS|nr:hypothetical protein [Chitinibacter fontanus]QLI82186.1 hypothetical protein HZU75_11980 [Chitinibacter fontanus]
MQDEVIQIGNLQFKRSDIKQHWVDYESAKERAIRLEQQGNHYIGSPFGLLLAGVVSTWLRKKKRQPDAKQYLHIKTAKDDYCFSEDEVDFGVLLEKLGK